jgi:hypothetical protein
LSSSLILISRRQSISTILVEQRPSSTGRHHPPWSSTKVVCNRPPWSGGIIRGWSPRRSATIFHGRRQQSDILVREQLQQGIECTINKEVVS